MSQLLTAVRRSSRARGSNSYEDLDESSLPSGDYSSHIAEEIEMASVSVIPDDTFTVGQAVNQLGFGWFQVKLSLFTGLCWMADSMEMTLLSILSPALHCDWHITTYQQALTTTVVFLGMMLSSTFWGNLSDRYGRKKTLTLCAVMLCYYGLISSLAPNFLWILFLRSLVGFAIGCVPQSVTLYAEFLPTAQRAKCVVLLDCFWALGACFEVVLALLVMPTLGWHWLLGLSSLPLLAFAFITPWLPESARYHVSCGEPEKALETLQRVARENGKPLPLGRLVLDGTGAGGLANRGRVRDLLIPELRKTTLLLWFIWAACAFCYYGVVLMTTELFNSDVNSSCDRPSENGPRAECAADCRELTTRDYMDLLWTTFAEFPGIFATIFVIERFGRKRTIAAQFIIFAICISFLFLCTNNRAFLTTLLFIARGIIAGLFQAAYVYTPEVYPTCLRSVGVGSCSGMARLGAMVTPYVAQVLLQTSLINAAGVYAFVSFVAAIAAICLPFETGGQEMKDSIQSRSQNNNAASQSGRT